MAVPRGPWRLHVVPHTHWDREWYLPLEPFRIRLAETVDEVLDVLEQQPHMRFTLDGQSVILDDYREYRPGEHEQGGCGGCCGPGAWRRARRTCSPTSCSSAASRWCAICWSGSAVCRRYGAEPARIGYAPDAFGHVAQMPQILRGFGLDHLIFTRGLGDEAEGAGAVMWWEGPTAAACSRSRRAAPTARRRRWAWRTRDGRRITDPDRGSEEAAAERVRGWLARYGPAHLVNGLRDVLLCNGVDHRRIQRNLHEMLAPAPSGSPARRTAIAGYEDYVDALREQLTRLRLKRRPRRAGRPAASSASRAASTRRGWSSSRPTTRSSCCCRAPRRWPRSPGARSDYRTRREALEVAWRHLLRAQPHDSIAGCSVDQVHRDMRHRFDVAREIAERVGQEALAALSGEGREAIWHWAGEPGRGAASSTSCRGRAGARSRWHCRCRRPAGAWPHGPRPAICRSSSSAAASSAARS